MSGAVKDSDAALAVPIASFGCKLATRARPFGESMGPALGSADEIGKAPAAKGAPGGEEVVLEDLLVADGVGRAKISG